MCRVGLAARALASDAAHPRKNGKRNGFVNGTTESPRADNLFLNQLVAEVLNVHCSVSTHAEKLWQDVMSILDSLPSKVRIWGLVVCKPGMRA